MNDKKTQESKAINDISDRLVQNIEAKKVEIKNKNDDDSIQLEIDKDLIDKMYSDKRNEEHKKYQEELKNAEDEQSNKNNANKDIYKKVENNITFEYSTADSITEHGYDEEIINEKNDFAERILSADISNKSVSNEKLVNENIINDNTSNENIIDDNKSYNNQLDNEIQEVQSENINEIQNSNYLMFDESLENEISREVNESLNGRRPINTSSNEENNKNTNVLKKENIFTKIGNKIDGYYEERRRSKTHNGAMSKVLVAVSCVFMSLIVYIVYFVMFDSKDKLNNPYNERSILMEETVLRGTIYSEDEKILAQTTKDNNEWKRYYPYGSLFSHVVGRYDKGKTGIELGNDYDLLTTNDTQVDKILNDINDEKSQGNSIITTLDFDLQKIASNELNGKKGAAVAIEPSTGKILAMVSKPDYDPNYIKENWESYANADNSKNALLNRATQGLYPPGSTFKVVSALEYIKQGDYMNYSYKCEGISTFDGRNTRCYNSKVHGVQNFITSFANSCNTSFGNIGTKLDITKFNATCSKLLFNKDLPYDYTYKSSSFDLMQGSKTTLRVDTAIGQGKTVITPLHNALIAAAVANDGILMKPYLVDKIVSTDMNVVDCTQAKKAATFMSSSEARILNSMMQEVVNRGTAKALKNNRYTVAGKTGSAEYDDSNKSHAWFIGFAPATNPQIAVSIIVEEAGTGGAYAVPIAKKMFDNYVE